MKNSGEKRLLLIRNCGKPGKYRFTPLSPGDLSEIDEESFDLPFLHSKPHIYFNSCRGLLCFYERKGHIYVLNPKTKQFQFFPTKADPSLDKTRTSLFGACVGYDSKSDDYKILRVCERALVGHYRRTSETFELYSLSKDSWKAIDKPIRPRRPYTDFVDLELPYIPNFKAIYVRDKCYWFTLDGRVVSLDWSKESFCEEFDLPAERRPSRDFSRHELVQFNGGESLGVVRRRSLQLGNYYELWEWREDLRRWDIKFNVCLGGAVGRPPGTVYGTFLFLHGMAGKPGDNLHRLVAYDWTNKDCKELGIHNYGFPIKKHRMECFEINVFCYVESSVALPHGEPIIGSGFLNHLPVVDELDDWLDNYCDCDCHDDDSTEDDSECKCCRGYTDAYKIDIEDFAVNGFRILSDTKEVGPDISKKQLALKPTAGNPDAQGGKKKKKKKKKKKTPDAQGNISRHYEEGELNICSNAQGVDMFPMINRLFVGSIPVLAFSIIQLDPESSDHHQYKKQGGLNFAHHLTKTEA